VPHRPASLLRACERALVASARRQGGSTRQQVRAAARRFVRRHRRDAAFLSWVLRCLASTPALAIALLGLSAEPASARVTVFERDSDFSLSVPHYYARPALGDFDADGDRDLVVGHGGAHFVYFENTGGPANPVFLVQSGSGDPFDELTAGFMSDPAVGDIDGDGDLDLVSGDYGTFDFLENTGSATSPAFTSTGSTDPFAGIPNTGQLNVPALGDLDRDGDLDLVVGGQGGFGIRYFENTGSATAAAFLERTGTANPFAAVLVPSPTPALGDVDNDGDLDLSVGSYYGSHSFFENTGTAKKPAFVARTAAASPFHGDSPSSFTSRPALGDLDGDGDLDQISGFYDGSLAYFENHLGDMVLRTGAANPFGGLSPAFNSGPALGDLDHDGDLDLVAVYFDGDSSRGFYYFENTGSSANPVFVERTGSANPLDAFHIPGFTPLDSTLGDLDGDGDLDLVVSGGLYGSPYYFENTGTAASPAFTEAIDPFNGQYIGDNVSLGDLDDDGDLDLVGGRLGYANPDVYFENIGTATSPDFVERTGAANPIPSGLPGFMHPEFADLDGDGDLDLVSGPRYGEFYYSENTGTASSPAFVHRTPIDPANPFLGVDMGVGSVAVALGDLDGDGDADLVAGKQQGTSEFSFIENAIVRRSPAALELTGGANPFAGVIQGLRAFGDLDGDGDLDLYVRGGFSAAYYVNQGTAAAPHFVLDHVGTFAGVDYLGRSVAFADLDRDGDLDLISGLGYPDLLIFQYFENQGTATNPGPFALVEGPFDSVNFTVENFGIGISTVDLDVDGDLDIVMGGSDGTFLVFANTGSATAPGFAQVTGGANPLDGLDAGDFANPSLGDVDGDGDLDLFSGRYAVTSVYFENTGSAQAPAYIERTGAANPMTGVPGGVPTLADLDADGDLDLADLNGHTFYFPEPARRWLFGAGAALVGLLARVRRRV
jgi:FG-GAP-like repeat